MGKFALILILAAAGTAVYHGASSGEGLASAAGQASEAQRRVLARSAAKTGWQRAKQELVGGLSAGTITGRNGGASYTVTTTLAGAEAIVVSEGRMPIPGKSDPTRYTLTYRLRAVGGDDLPAFADYAVAVNGDMDMSGNGAIVTPGIPGPAGDSLGIRVHANGNLHAGSASTTVQGFGSYTTSATGKLGNTFQPRANPSRDPALSRTDSVRIPKVVPSQIVAAHGGATRTYPPNPSEYWDVEIREPLVGGTRDNPAVYYVQGNALLVNLTISGYAIIVADGQVKVGGHLRGTPESGRAESAVAVYTSKDIVMNGGANVFASLFANGGLDYNGNVDIWGNLIIGGDFAHGGGATVHYVPPAPSLFGTWAGGDPALELLAFREH